MRPIRRSMAAAGALALLLATSLAAPAIGAGTEGSGASFSPAGVLPEERHGATATGLADGRILVVGGDVDIGGAPAYIWEPVVQSFVPAGSLEEPRDGPTATLLIDGRVLIVGGLGGSPRDSISLASAETWDPATASFSRTGSPAEARAGHTATLLADGRVLVVGSARLLDGAIETLGTAELWDPATGAFSPTGALESARFGHTATRLPDGRVLIVGGAFVGDDGFGIRATAEIWDPETGAFSPAGSLPDGRINHTATLVSDDRVLVVGGVGNSGASLLESAMLWDPATESFSQTGALESGRAEHTATSLPDGAVLIVGGNGDLGVLDSAELWDPSTGVFHPAGSLAIGRSDHTATLDADERVLVVGGVDDNVMYIASAESWASLSTVVPGE